ncbi:murein transglycosylase A [Myxosarcina sp. GI1]|uniref:murein transglycosylase A n=1 Tax=Myxosarcina sp. GI1 TaxID=1541065 RepID=UPI00056AACEC|nr:MltA domain-containing protein [Myxosarcina sp. GI1]
MKNSLAIKISSISVVATVFFSSIATAAPLKAVRFDEVKLGLDERLSSDCESERCSLVRDNGLLDNKWNEVSRNNLKQAIDNSLYYLSTPKAAKDYHQSQSKFDLARVRRSLVRFRQLLLTSNSPADLAQAVEAEFVLYQSIGKDRLGTVEFTGYFEPLFKASRVPTAEYRYPLYRLPTLAEGNHPTRIELEGTDGLGNARSILAGYELVWLRDRLEAYLVQVQGAAKLQLTDGTIMSVGYGGSTDYPYVSIGGELVKDSVFAKEELSLPKLINYFKEHPDLLDKYIPRNNRFIFFRETNGAAPTGSLGVPVTGDRTIATDKSLMPPGALALIVAPIPKAMPTGEIATKTTSQYVLDQDTGSAIKGAGRVDIFLGSGAIAGERAGRLNGTGKLYYLLLKE